MTFKFFDKLSQDFSKLLSDKKEYNVVIEVDKERNKKSFTAHSVVLRYRSPYFDKELENAPMNKNHIKKIIKPNISAPLFEIILKYIYGGIINIEDTDTKTIYELMITANELELKELSRKLESYLIESKASWLRIQFSFVYHSIFDSHGFEGLKDFYNNIIVKYPNLIFESEDFTSLKETALIPILKRDDLNIEEIKIWDYVIKWGISQNPTLPADSKKWSKKNFEALKITLQRCLPLIRYFHISGEDILEKVKPYKKILEKQLWGDIIQHSISPNKSVTSLILQARIISNPELPSRTIPTHELPSRVNESLSTIINEEHVAELSSWIDRKSIIYSSSNIPYEFQLILRGSRDGFDPVTFWNMCHGHAGTIVVAKVTGTDETVGGYNPLTWDNLKSGWMKTNDSFIFSLKNRNIQNSVLSRVINSNGALFYSDSNEQNIYGPFFGSCEFMMKSEVSDFTQDKQCWCTITTLAKYEKPIRKTNDNFSIYDYEVTGTDETVGGYNPLTWDNLKSGWMKTNDSFIFSLKNRNIQNSVLSRVINSNGALFYSDSNEQNIYGPFFGSCEFMMKSEVSDFTQDKQCWCTITTLAKYEKPIRKTNDNFSIYDYEVFKIIKKQIPNCTIR
ncbi:hypothetical protein Glove_482g74 [Diversispora epigaea]|uniref:BTB domain-containing protein n=1 Tax=Diversispora epigaea TaxID=1348612 RepID=A0A397GNV2_9GLOM|nr:hypothetical protein Glove_482g74 [Diversispora epigaea]